MTSIDTNQALNDCLERIWLEFQGHSEGFCYELLCYAMANLLIRSKAQTPHLVELNRFNAAVLNCIENSKQNTETKQ